ncbi:MAG: glucose-1-phosphate cytidylyltransferase [Deltaproteobacteria bacterium]|nr:glucose-1-phosphate cytidylyltransferase [Deltaproteobacteria bacterium]
MKTVILAGGLGTRLSEETVSKPKPMVEVGEKPILWHIMNIYGAYGFQEFVLALGYKAEIVKEYFLNFRAVNSDLTIDLGSGEEKIHARQAPPWKIHLVDTGLATQTGGRLRRLRSWLADEQTFMMTYGDGVADVNIEKLVQFHNSHGKLATVTAVPPPARFGSINFEGNRVAHFVEKPQVGDGWINGGFFVLDRRVLDFIEGDETLWERQPLERLAEDGQLMAYKHEGFWQPMDTLRDKRHLDGLWESGRAPWKVWS